MAGPSLTVASPSEVSALLGNCGPPTISKVVDIGVEGWVSESSARGTWTLLYSCIFTIGLCIWTAIHMNISGPQESPRMALVRKIEWALVAIFAPEVVLAAALLQYNRARKLRSFLKGKSRVALELKRFSVGVTHRDTAMGISATTICLEEWSLTYCFYVIMGGFTVDLSTLPNGRGRGEVTLTDDAIRELANLGHFLCLPTQVIKDRSKADVLAKALAVCQVGWLVVQSIARFRAGLQLTLLEIHAMVHVFSAFVMYICWFCKPKDLQSTTPVNITGIEEDLRGMLDTYDPFSNKLELKQNFYTRYFVKYLPSLYGDYGTHTASDIFLWVSPALLCAANAAVHMTASKQWGAKSTYFPTYVEEIMWDTANYILLGIAAVLLVVSSTIAVVNQIKNHGQLLEWLRSILSVFLLTPLLPRDASYISRYFPSVFWKKGRLEVALFLAGLVLLLSTGARIFVIVESFISLRTVPLTVYVVPDWTMYFPHL